MARKAFLLTLFTIRIFSNCPEPETWSGTLSGNWDETANWSPACVPGSGAVTDTDSAAFGSTVGKSSIISLDGVPIDPGLGKLIFDNPTTPFTIFSSTHFLQFNGASSSIDVLSGRHFLNTPVHLTHTVLNIHVTDLLTVQGNFSDASTSSIKFTGPGQLLNTNEITINGRFSIFSGTVANTNTAAVSTGFGALIQSGQDFFIKGELLNSNSGKISGIGAVGSAVISEANLTMNGTVSIRNKGAISNGGNGCLLHALDATVNRGTITFENTGPIKTTGAGNFISLRNLTINSGSILNSNSGAVTSSITFGSFISVQSQILMNGGTLTNINTGAVSSQGIGSLIEAEKAFTIMGGTLVNNDTVWTPLLTIGEAGTLTGSGVIQNVNRAPTTQVANAGSVIPEGVMTIQGSYTQAPSGTLGIHLLNPSSFSQLEVTGAAALAGNLEVSFVPRAVVKPGETFSIVEAGGVAGTFSNVISSTDNLIPQVHYFPTSVLLSFTPAASKYPDYFETLFATNNHLNHRLERQMAQLKERFYHRIEEPAPKVGFFRFPSKGCDIPVCEEHPWNVYLGPTGDIGHVLTKKDGVGFGYGSAGALAGFDYAFSQVGVGLLVNYDHIKGSGAHHWGKFDINHAHANLYAIYSPVPELSVNGILGGGYDWIDIQRNAGIKTIPAVGKGSPQGGEFDALLGLEYAFDRNKFCAIPACLQVAPLVSIQYIYLHAEKYREHGAGLFDLNFSGQTAQSLRSTVGARLNYTWKWADVSFTPEFNVGWQREFLDKGRFLNFTPVDFAVPTASLNMPRAGRNVALAGVDFLVTLFDRYGIEASYDFEWNSLFHDQFFYLGCQFRF
jgi:hypothetical protein